MFSRVLVLAAVATAVMARTTNVCNAGNVQCCNQVQEARSVQFDRILSAGDASNIGSLLNSSTILVGLDCSPLDVMSASGQCNQQTVCCDGARFDGLVSINCNTYNGGVTGLLEEIPAAAT